MSIQEKSIKKKQRKGEIKKLSNGLKISLNADSSVLRIKKYKLKQRLIYELKWRDEV